LNEQTNIKTKTKDCVSNPVEVLVMRKPRDIVYLNLTNGLEALPSFADSYKVCRIQSTACEQKRWDFIIADLDYNLLFDLALGKTCFIIDYTQRKKVPRALFQGVEWIKFVLNRIWLDKEYKPLVRGNDASRYFAEMYKTLQPSTIKKVNYLKKFMNTKEINLITVAEKTANDGNYSWYTKIAHVYA